MLLFSLFPIATAAFPALNIAVPGSRVRLVIVGDTGALPVPEDTDAAWEGSHYNTVESREQLRRSIRREQADGIVAMGDLVYGPGFRELSPRCRDTDRVAEEWLDPALGDYYDGLGTTWMVLGNHDVGHNVYSRARARCLRYYAATTEELRLPETSYTVDFGLAHLFVLDTNRPARRWPSEEIQRRIDGEDGWVIMGGHHVLKTSFNKEGETEVREWLAETGLTPDLWINGHAHFLQFGVYDGIPALTSGAGSKVRVRPDCPGEKCTGAKMPLFSRSTFGYAVVDLTVDEMTIRFKDLEGQAMFCWQQNRAGQVLECPLEEPAEPVWTPEVSQLGQAPLCEASAGLALPDGSVLVADNEVDDALFSMQAVDGALSAQIVQTFASKERDEIEDIEALTAVGGEVLVVGSHSRSRKCKPQSDRRRLGLGTQRVKTSDEEWSARTASVEDCRAVLFGGAAGEEIGRLCAAIVAAEAADGCENTLNIEGALTDAEGRVWLGLRAPVVEGRGAAMVRLSEDFMSKEALSLDAVAWMTLPVQQGIRELHRDGEFILGISGSVESTNEPMTLWRAPLGGLVPDGRMSVSRLSILPPSSEGFARVGADLIVLIDGDDPRDDGACREPAGQVRIVAP